MANEEIRIALLKSGVKQWQVAQEMKKADSNFSALLRTELSAETKNEILSIIEKLKQ